tara:strand:- start:525 stop:1706 length:1182 start_codon:yes stop_codon:yes gene_type:complete
MRFDFRRIGLNDLENHLTNIAKKEEIVINEEAISLIAKHSQGGLRDAESLLDQISLLPPPITQSNIISLIGSVPEEELIQLAKSLTDKDPKSILDICNHLINKGKEPIAILQGIASILRDLVVTKVTNNPTNLCNISHENSGNLKNLANSITLDQILCLQAKLKGSENYIRNSNQPKLWLEIHLLGMLSDVNLKEEINTTTKSFFTAKISNKSYPENLNKEKEKIKSETHKDVIKEVSIEDESQASENINLDGIWKKVIAMLELPSTKMLLTQQAKLTNLNSNSAEITISEKWINMIQSRKNIIEDAFYKAIGSSIKVTLIQQKDHLSNKKEKVGNPKQIEKNVEFKFNRETQKNNFKDPNETLSKNSLDSNSIDKKAKQFADFFNGEIINLE